MIHEYRCAERAISHTYRADSHATEIAPRCVNVLIIRQLSVWHGCCLGIGMKIKKHIVASGVLLMVTTTIYGATERQVATGKDTLRLTLRDAVELAQRQSPSVQSARNT